MYLGLSTALGFFNLALEGMPKLVVTIQNRGMDFYGFDGVVAFLVANRKGAPPS